MNIRPEYVWDQLAPSTQEGQHRARLEGEESLTEMTEEDLANNARVIDPTSNRYMLDMIEQLMLMRYHLTSIV